MALDDERGPEKTEGFPTEHRREGLPTFESRIIGKLDES